MVRRIDKAPVTAFFQELLREFPGLQGQLDLDPANVAVQLILPEQPGLRFALVLYLDGDALHMCAGENLWLEWFPCTKPSVVSSYQETVRGLLAGSFRIVEHYRRGRVFKAQLQRLVGSTWNHCGTSSRVHVPWPFGVERRVLQVPEDAFKATRVGTAASRNGAP